MFEDEQVTMVDCSVGWQRLKMRGMLALVSPLPTLPLCTVHICLPLSPVYHPDEKFSNYLILLESTERILSFSMFRENSLGAH